MGGKSPIAGDGIDKQLTHLIHIRLDVGQGLGGERPYIAAVCLLVAVVNDGRAARAQAEGVQRVMVVTHGWHMPRALRAFRQEAERLHYPVQLQAAPMGLARPSEPVLLQWLPSVDGYRRVHQVLREMLGWVAGA